jgi:hypothetical protein
MGYIVNRKSIATTCIILLFACFIVVNTILLYVSQCVDILYLQFPLLVQIFYFSNIIGRICFSTEYVNFQIKCLNGLKTKLESSYNRQWKIVTIFLDILPTVICVVWVYNLLSPPTHVVNLHDENCTFILILNVVQLVLFLPISFWGFVRSVFFLLQHKFLN